MLEQAPRPLGAVPIRQRGELRTVAQLQKRKKKAFPGEVPIIVRGITESALDVFSFGLTE